MRIRNSGIVNSEKTLECVVIWCYFAGVCVLCPFFVFFAILSTCMHD